MSSNSYQDMKPGASYRGILRPEFDVSDPLFYSHLMVMTSIAGLLHIFWFWQGFYAIGWDESGRTLDAYSWTHERSLLNTGTGWLPFYRIVVGLSLEAFPDLFLTPRVISFIFGIVSLWALGWFTYELYGDNRLTLVTVILGTFFSARIVLSLVPLSSIMFTSAILLGMASFARWIYLKRSRDLLLFGAVFAVSGTIRYEGWIFSAIVFSVVASLSIRGDSTPRWQEVGLLLFIVVAFPVFAILTYSVQTGHAFGFVESGSTQYSSIALVIQNNPLFQFVKMNTLSLNILGLISVAYLWKSSARLRILIAVPTITLLITSAILLFIESAQSGATWRMTGPWSMLLLPFTAHLILSLTRLPCNIKIRRLSEIGLLSLVLLGFSVQTLSVYEDSAWAFQASELALGRYLDEILIHDPDARMLIESSEFFYLNIIVASQHPEAFVRNSTAEQPEIWTGVLTPDTQICWDEIMSLDIRYLVFRTERFTRWLDQYPDVEKIRDAGEWSVYTFGLSVDPVP